MPPRKNTTSSKKKKTVKEKTPEVLVKPEALEQPEKEKETIEFTTDTGYVPEVKETPEAEETEEILELVPEVEKVVEVTPKVEETFDKVQDKKEVKMENISSEALDILTAHQMSMSSFYQKKAQRVAPKRPLSPSAVAEAIGKPSAAQTIQEWNAKMIERFRPRAGHAPVVAETPRQILMKINAT